MTQRLLRATLPLVLTAALAAQTAVHIDHRYTNTDAQSLIGLPLGSHKTIVDKAGNLKWSQWTLKRRPLDSPIGFSDQMDGELAIQASAESTPLTMQSQSLYKDRYPFIVTKLAASNLTLEELAFAVDPEQDPAKLPTANSGARAFDVVRLTFTNNGTAPTHALLKLSGRNRNLPGHAYIASHSGIATESGEDVVLIDRADNFTAAVEDAHLTLALSAYLKPGESETLWLRLPYEYPHANPTHRNAELSQLSGTALLTRATQQWDAIWARGAHIHYPSQQLNNFFDSSLAYVLILTEYDSRGDLWVLDGPAVYRQYWGRGELFQARAMEVAGHLDPARQSIEHAFHIQNDDGEWDGPPVSGWPAWDNMGGNAGAAWDYYLYTRDAAWLAKAYPHMLSASEWIKAHREETTLEDVATTPIGARPIRRMLTGARCRTEPTPSLAPGEKTYWYGLLPWSYGDSGLPEGHSYSHNYLADYAIRVTSEAADALNHPHDAQWLNKEYDDYTAAIRASINRSITLEKLTPKYLPAMPTYPEGAYSQSFLAVTPTELYSPTDPLINGLITRMESEESQGLPTNVAWAGPAGVWPGEAMNIAETYLLRNDATHTADMLLAALNHSYTTNVFKEEILTDVTKPRACNTPHSKREDMQGTGDMPEAWGNANAVNLLRDMLVQERAPAPGTHDTAALHLFAGLPASWITPGETFSITNTPTTFGTRVSASLHIISATAMQITINPGNKPTTIAVHIPTDKSIRTIRVDGRSVTPSTIITIPSVSKPTTIDVETE